MATDVVAAGLGGQRVIGPRPLRRRLLPQLARRTGRLVALAIVALAAVALTLHLLGWWDL